MIKINKLVLAVTLTATPLLAAHWECGEHVRFGLPSESDQKLCREGYAVGYNYDYKVADWVSYRMTAQSAQGTVPRKDAFAEDREIPVAYRATLSDYKGSGYDRGHQAPAGDMKSNKNTMKESFLLSNMTPQIGVLNQKAWRVLEDKVNKWAVSRKDVQVITGPIFTGSEESIGQGVAIPSAYYKIVMDPAQTAGHRLYHAAGRGAHQPDRRLPGVGARGGGADSPQLLQRYARRTAGDTGSPCLPDVELTANTHQQMD